MIKPFEALKTVGECNGEYTAVFHFSDFLGPWGHTKYTHWYIMISTYVIHHSHIIEIVILELRLEGSHASAY
jgi:hypothetical protein